MRLIIPGEPVAKARPRFNTRTGIAYTPKATIDFENLVKYIASKEITEIIDGAVELNIVFCFPRPKSKMYKKKPMLREWKTSRGDIDNYIKNVMDALNGIAYRDDSQVVKVSAVKVICAGDEKPHTEIEIKNVG